MKNVEDGNDKKRNKSDQSATDKYLEEEGIANGFDVDTHREMPDRRFLRKQ